MDFNKIDNIEKFFNKSGVVFKNNTPNVFYTESMEEMNRWCSVAFAKLTDGKNLLEIVAIALDFLTRRQSAKQGLVRCCLEMDLILENTNKPVVMVDTEGKVDA